MTVSKKHIRSFVKFINQSSLIRLVLLSLTFYDFNMLSFVYYYYIALLQVFDMVNHEAFNQSIGVNVTGIRENYLQLTIGQETSLFLSLVPSSKGDDQAVDTANTQNLESAIVPLDSFDDVKLGEGNGTPKKKWGFPNRISCEIYL